MAEGNFNLRGDDGSMKPMGGGLILPKLVPMELIVEASPRRVYANAHTYHINSISVNSDQVANTPSILTFRRVCVFRVFLTNVSLNNNQFLHSGDIHICGRPTDQPLESRDHQRKL